MALPKYGKDREAVGSLVRILLATKVLIVSLSSAQAGEHVARPGKGGVDFSRSHPLALDSRLLVKVRLVAVNPRLSDVLRDLEIATQLNFEIGPFLSDHEPEFGDLQMSSVAAWKVMEIIAKKQLADGKWEKTPDGYRLTGTSLVPKVESPARWTWPVVVTLVVVGAAALLMLVISVLAIFSPSRPQPAPPAGDVHGG